MSIVVARTTFHGPDHTSVAEGSLWDSSHPIVKGAPELFQAAEELVQAVPVAPVVTARPRPVKPAAKRK